MEDISDRIIYARSEADYEVDRRRLARGAKAGQNQRVSRGAYVANSDWQSFDARKRYLARVAATAVTRRSRAVISHWSAAAIHDLPCLGGWPEQVHLVVPPSAGAHSTRGIKKHSLRLADEDIVRVGEVLVTSLARTLLDLASTASFMAAVVAVDRALLVDRRGQRAPMITREQLHDVWERAHPLRAHARSSAVFNSAETQAESPLESVSRVNMRVIGVPRPRLQVAHYDAAGLIGYPDFTWEVFGAIGEADGDVKYLNARMRWGRSADEVFIDEKVREDRLRALPRSVARWRWDVAMSPTQLASRLTRAGLPLGQKW